MANFSDDKLLVVSKHLDDTNLFSVGKPLEDYKHLVSIKILTDLTYLPDLITYEKLGRSDKKD